MGGSQEHASLNNYSNFLCEDDRPGPDYKEARNKENKRTSTRMGSSFHFHNSKITGNSLGGNSGVINNVEFQRKEARKEIRRRYIYSHFL